MAATAAGVPFLVGRDEEIGLLLRRWEQSKEGLGQVMLVSGEAGIGKSTLVETLRAHVVREGLPRIAFRCSPYHRNSALYPVITHVEHLLHFDRDDTPATKLDKLEQVLDRSFRGNVARTCPKKRFKSPPNVSRAFQRDQLQPSQSDGREHHKPFITFPAALDLLRGVKVLLTFYPSASGTKKGMSLLEETTEAQRSGICP